jgi:hypothetical protein
MSRWKLLRTRKELADVLRSRQLELAPVTSAQLGFDIKTFKQLIKTLSDDEIILSYITCSQCGEQLASLDDVDKVLEQNPETYDDFWDILDSVTSKHEH